MVSEPSVFELSRFDCIMFARRPLAENRSGITQYLEITDILFMKYWNQSINMRSAKRLKISKCLKWLVGRCVQVLSLKKYAMGLIMFLLEKKKQTNKQKKATTTKKKTKNKQTKKKQKKKKQKKKTKKKQTKQNKKQKKKKKKKKNSLKWRLFFDMFVNTRGVFKIKPGHSISHKIVWAPNEDSNQHAHQYSLIKVFAGHSLGSLWSKASVGGRRRLRSDCANAQADLSLRWAHRQFCNKYCAPALVWLL